MYLLTDSNNTLYSYDADVFEFYPGFPHPETADVHGTLAFGGELNIATLFLAYSYGIFPWYNHRSDPVIWWSPAPRFVIFPAKVKIAKSMRSYFNQQKYRVTYNHCFEAVMRQCEMIPRPGQDGTWINEDIIEAYTELHHLGFALSVEVWAGDQLVGGLYGVTLGKIFFGESMFSKSPNASKFGFISLANRLQQEGFTVIDCQQPTEHLKSLGGEFISKRSWFELLEKNRKYLIKKNIWFDEAS